ncbi:MAG: rRNA maturation RNase YbeY [Candidatus Kerfeldbacteria bacterium]|nr:rRNA maturation RNase YbeY [Candidatus Kerfeldbacteria bacterium]
MTVFLDIRRVNTAPLLGRTTLRALCHKTIRAIAPGLRHLAVSVAWVDRRRMRQANERYRKQPGPTDVLSFTYRQPGSGAPSDLNGEILLCPSVVRERAAGRGLTARRYAEWLFVHAVLHLLGHNHRHAHDRQRMERSESRILGEHFWGSSSFGS